MGWGRYKQVNGAIRQTASFFCHKDDLYLVAGRLLFTVDPEEHGFLCVVALHLHHDVIFAGFLFGAVRPQRSKSVTRFEEADWCKYGSPKHESLVSPA